MTHDTFIHIHRPDPPHVHGIQNLEDHHCRFIINTDLANPIFCGRRADRGTSWCGSCRRIVYKPVEQRRSAA